MERKVRNRVSKNDLHLLLIKMLPWIFIVLIYLAASSMGFGGSGPDGAIKPGYD